MSLFHTIPFLLVVLYPCLGQDRTSSLPSNADWVASCSRNAFPSEPLQLYLHFDFPSRSVAAPGFITITAHLGSFSTASASLSSSSFSESTSSVGRREHSWNPASAFACSWSAPGVIFLATYLEPKLLSSWRSSGSPDLQPQVLISSQEVLQLESIETWVRAGIGGVRDNVFLWGWSYDF